MTFRSCFFSSSSKLSSNGRSACRAAAMASVAASVAFEAAAIAVSASTKSIFIILFRGFTSFSASSSASDAAATAASMAGLAPSPFTFSSTLGFSSSRSSAFLAFCTPARKVFTICTTRASRLCTCPSFTLGFRISVLTHASKPSLATSVSLMSAGHIVFSTTSTDSSAVLIGPSRSSATAISSSMLALVLGLASGPTCSSTIVTAVSAALSASGISCILSFTSAFAFSSMSALTFSMAFAIDSWAAALASSASFGFTWICWDNFAHSCFTS
mmetsp:Transcript_71230/g.123690  ORF Transcript_71230/g.123690 Transcript_71230/m.123690 type:complete len:272 (+) Transcript_71230:734-1549(+)